MAMLPKRPCGRPGCGNTQPCPVHHRDADRPTAVDRGYDREHNLLRVLAFERDGFRCVDCGWEPSLVREFREAGLGMPDTPAVMEELRTAWHRRERHLHGDHVVPIRVRPDLKSDLANYATRCSSCHDAKTMREIVANK